MCLKGDICTYPKCDCNKPRLATDIVWETKREYKKENLVLAMGQTWECTKDHTSNIFGTDALENKYWKEWEYD